MYRSESSTLDSSRLTPFTQSLKKSTEDKAQTSSHFNISHYTERKQKSSRGVRHFQCHKGSFTLNY